LVQAWAQALLQVHLALLWGLRVLLWALRVLPWAAQTSSVHMPPAPVP
jgi:hypothetical protein